MTPIHERIHRAIVEAQGWEVNMFLPEDSIIRSLMGHQEVPS